MDDFEIPVTYNGKDLLFKAQLLNYGYTHKITVEVNGQLIQLEPDEERKYRATINPDDLENTAIDIGLIQAIIGVIESV